VRIFSLLLALVALGRTAVDAQVRGVVTDAGRRPVTAATVEVWTGLRKTSVARTDSAGRFAIAPAAERATGIVVRRLGFEPFSTALGQGDTALVIRLHPATLGVRGVTATARARLCPAADDAAARAAWEGASRRYAEPRDTFIFHAFAWSRTATADSAPEFADDSGRWERRWMAGNTGAWPHFRRDVRMVGYAFPVRGMSIGEQYALWQYLPLEWTFAHHFADPLFGERHTFRRVGSVDGETTIAFCRRPGERQPEVEGTITLGADSTFRRARWKYITPRMMEDAAAEVVFVPPSAATRSMLLVDSYRFSRRTPARRFYLAEARYDEWRLYPGDIAPPVPRDPTGSWSVVQARPGG